MYNVAVALHQATEPATVKISIEGPQFHNAKTLKIYPHEVKQLSFDIPVLSDGDFNITAEGVAGVIFKNSSKLNHQVFHTLTKIQTDKIKYEPGDFVNFRVLFLDENLKPRSPAPDAVIWFEDGNQNHVKEYKNFTVTKGVYTGKFKISECPILGKWRLGVSNGGSRVTINSFDVEKHVLPKYVVTVDSTEYLSVKDGDIAVVVRAKYPDGRPVNAKVTLVTSMGTSAPSIIQIKNIMNGIAKFDVSVKQYKDYIPSYSPAASLGITAMVEENFTGVKINDSTSAYLFKDRYHVSSLKYFACKNYKPDEEFEITISLSFADDISQFTNKEEMRLRFTETVESIGQKEEVLPEEIVKIEQKVVEFVSNFNGSRRANFKVKLPHLEEFEGYAHFFQLQVQIRDEIHNLTNCQEERPSRVTKPEITKSEEPKPFFNVEVDYPEGYYSFKPQEKVIISIKSSSPLNYFDYNIIGRGNILSSERVFVPNNATTYDLTLTPTFLWMPYSRFYAYYVDELGEFHYAETIFSIYMELPNKLEIFSPSDVKPGDDVTLRIKTAPHSFVGLLVVDQSITILGLDNTIEADDFSWRLSSYTTNAPWQDGDTLHPGGRTGVMTLTNAHMPKNEEHELGHEAVTPLGNPGGTVRSMYSLGSPLKNNLNGGVMRVPSEFAKTWIFADIPDTQATEFNWTLKSPDTVSLFTLSGFALHEELGLAVTYSRPIFALKRFLISIRLPQSVKSGEIINVLAIVANYARKDLAVNVTLENTYDEYEFMSNSNKIKSESKIVKVVHVPELSTAVVGFMLRPKVVGNVMLKFIVNSSAGGEVIQRTLKVVPEGVTEYVNRAGFVNLNEARDFQQSFDLVLPPDVVAHSVNIEFSVFHDLLGPLLNNLESSVRQPIGGAEQIMSNLMPNYFVLKYLKRIKNLTPALEAEILQHLETGYQRILGFSCSDGSFATYRDEAERANGSVWLTAHVARSLQQLQGVIKVDDSLLTKSFQYLASHQAVNGSFIEKSNLTFVAERQRGVPLTALVLLAFLENKDLTAKYQAHIDKALEFVLGNVDMDDSIYARALATYALQRAKHPQSVKELNKLMSAAKSHEGRKWWLADENRWSSLNADIEATSYVLLTLIDQNSDKIENLLPIVNWLIAQRNSMGGFISTQDTVVGLQALIEFAGIAQYGVGVMDLEVMAKGETDWHGTMKVTEDNGRSLQSVVLPPGTTSVNMHAKGNGTALIQIAYQYNVKAKDPQSNFIIETAIKNNTNNIKLEMDVCLQYVGMDDASNMALLEIALPSGYVARTDALAHIESLPFAQQVESQKSDTLIVIYFESLPKAQRLCVPIEALREYAVARQKPASIMLYDYYDTLKSATTYYELVSQLCEICENDEECLKACE